MRCRFRVGPRDNFRGELLGIETTTVLGVVSQVATILPDESAGTHQYPLTDVLAAWPDIEDDDHLLDDGDL